jgi:hypothetical protein
MKNSKRSLKFIPSLVTIFCLFFFISPASFAHSGSHDITLIYTGNLDGELEPCGCSEGGDKGGLKRRANVLDRLRKVDPKLYLISSGGLLISEVAQDKLKSKYILKGMEALDYDAIGVQWKDLSYGAELLNKTSLPFIMSNNSNDTFFGKSIINHKHASLAFFSWLDPSRNPQKNMHDPIVKNDTKSLADNLKIAKSRKQLTILSTTLPLKLAKRRLPLDDVDILLIKAKYEHFGEARKEGKLLILQPGSRGMRMGKLNLTVSTKGEILKWKHEVIPLPPEVGDAPRMKQWYDNYNAEVKSDYEKRVAIRKKLESGESPYSGEEVCKSCHIKEHEKWSNTRHAEAFYALQDVNKSFDPACIKCHTVGFEKAGGFIDPSITDKLMHVQCENCHGAAKAHAQSAGKIPVSNKGWSSEKICSQCHIQKHSPDFNFKTYWPKIAHGKNTD